MVRTMINVFQSFSYNTQLAKTYGIKSSIYLSYVGFERSFNRADMYSVTGLNVDEQCDVEYFLSSNGLITAVTESSGCVSVVIDQNKIKMLSECADIVVGDVKVVKKSRTTSKKSNADSITRDQILEAVANCNTKNQICASLNITAPTLNKVLSRYNIALPVMNKKTKQDKMYDSMIRSVNTGDEVVNQYVIDWINSVRDNPKRYMTKQSFDLSLNKMLNFYVKQEDRIEVLKIAIKGSYSDIDWAIDRYEDRKPINNNFANYSEIKSDGSEMVGETF